ncbi:snoRNA binding domain protein [Ancylostoma duodenale]|uniref:Nucleolar protein 56 n=1 Tax=Ancylostoma duodenale TaxID=51022 RepID=A0A0C2H623_9BILA|nr:snoRNA binding domain protein [Ancylostoma duodenale]
MSEVPHYVLYEHAVGYALMKVKEFEDAGLIIQEVDASIADVAKFCGIVKLAAFDPFKNTEAALENANAISEGFSLQFGSKPVMSEVPHYVLYEHAVGYALMKVKEFEDAGLIIQEVDASIADVAKFCGIVKLAAFDPFKNTEAALENANAISEGLAHTDLINFLESSLPQKKKKLLLGVNDSKLAGSLTEANLGIQLIFGGVVTEILRGVRVHFAHLAKDLPHHSLAKAQLSLGHSYSRGKVKFDVHRVDNMVIQSIALLDQLDKDINLFGMRIREWYSYHFPELFKLVPDQYKYARLAVAILDRNKISENENIHAEITEIVEDEDKATEILEAARTSMGMDISEMDLANIERFASRVASLTEYRQRLHEYIKDRMNSCAPSLSALIGEQVGARLISHAGSLTNLAKYPASTVQILGAEKALFRALKTRSATPKYGLLFHSSFIGRASTKNKGRISRFLANKCTIASRIDCFSEVPVPTFGEFLKGQVEERLKYFETGEIPQKNIDVMAKAQDEAKTVQEKVLKKRKKAAKKAKKIKEQAESGGTDGAEPVPETKPKKRAAEEAVEDAEAEEKTGKDSRLHGRDGPGLKIGNDKDIKKQYVRRLSYNEIPGSISLNGDEFPVEEHHHFTSNHA